MIYDGWPPLGRTLVLGVLSYAALVGLLRISGKRTLSKWNAFDFVVTIALGSTLASALLSKTTSLAQGTLAFGVLVGLQYLITWASIRSKLVQSWIKATPSLLLYRGAILHESLRRERVTEGEVRAAIRARGFAAVEAVEAVVLETDGSFSVIETLGDRDASAFQDVRGFSDVVKGT